MRVLDQNSFADYIRERWVQGGIEVGEVEATPYKEMVNPPGGFAFGISVYRDGAKARGGVWFRPTPGGLVELAALRNHYQQTLQKQNRFVRIQNCGTEFGTFFFFWEATQPHAQSAWQPWVQLVEESSQLAFDNEALDTFLERFR